jgi:microcystin-dependent protein
MKSQSPESGMTLMEVILAGGIGTIIIAGVTLGMMNIVKTGNKTNTSIDITGIKARVLNSVDCQQTLPVPCVDNTYIDLKDKDNDVVVSSGGTNIGKFTVRGLCLNNLAQKGIDVRAAWLTSAGSASTAAKAFGASSSSWFVKDEVATNLVYDWKHPKTQLFSSLGSGGGLLCGPDGGPQVPVGSVFYIAGALAPPGFLLANGDVLPNGTGTVQGKTGDFSRLYAVLGSAYGALGQLPDLRGEFVRGLDSGRGIDAGRVLGTSQLDQFQGHRNLAVQDPFTSSFQTGFQAWSSEGSGTASGGGAAMRQKNVWDSISTDGVNGAPRVGRETRPRNVALLPVIKF